MIVMMILALCFFICTVVGTICIEPIGFWSSWSLCYGTKEGTKTRSHQLNMFISEDVCTFYDSNDIIQFRMCSSKAGIYTYMFFSLLFYADHSFSKLQKEEILYVIVT